MVKDNRKNLKDAIETAFNAAVFPAVPQDGGALMAHRTPRDRIDVLPARAAGIVPAGQTGRQICRVKGRRRPKMKRKRR
ncbi:MAG: hypothetical protein WA553_05305, partial [Methylocella sp.]